MATETNDTLDDWGANFDGVDIEPFLRHLASYVESGFGEVDAKQAARKIRRLSLWFGPKLRLSYDIRVAGSPAKLKMRVLKDDLDAFLISFKAPKHLCEIMATERKRIEHELIANTTFGDADASGPSERTPVAGWLRRLLSLFRRDTD